MPKKTQKDSKSILEDPSNIESLASLLATADEEETTPDKSPVDQDWLSELNSVVSSSILSEDEMQVIGMYKRSLGTADNVKPGELSWGEKSILNKWKASKTRNE